MTDAGVKRVRYGYLEGIFGDQGLASRKIRSKGRRDGEDLSGKSPLRLALTTSVPHKGEPLKKLRTSLVSASTALSSLSFVTSGYSE